jgi:hypothetical protein
MALFEDFATNQAVVVTEEGETLLTRLLNYVQKFAESNKAAFV